jgi:hypothetical protein
LALLISVKYVGHTISSGFKIFVFLGSQGSPTSSDPAVEASASMRASLFDILATHVNPLTMGRTQAHLPQVTP